MAPPKLAKRHGSELIASDDTKFIRSRRTKQHKNRSNLKEHNRQVKMNNAYAALRVLLPTDPPEVRLSKVEVLRRAISYTNTLLSILHDYDELDRQYEQQEFVASPVHVSPLSMQNGLYVGPHFVNSQAIPVYSVAPMNPATAMAQMVTAPWNPVTPVKHFTSTPISTPVAPTTPIAARNLAALLCDRTCSEYDSGIESANTTVADDSMMHDFSTQATQYCDVKDVDMKFDLRLQQCIV